MDLSVYLSVISTAAIVCAGVFAGLQVRQLYRQRERESAMQLLHSFQTPHFMEALDVVFNLPDGLSKAEIEERVGSRMTSMLVMFGTFESLGILISRHEMSLALVDDFFSGPVVLVWRKFRKYIEEVRAVSQRDTYAEYVQWLAEQFEKRESKTPAVPAYIALRDWQP